MKNLVYLFIFVVLSTLPCLANEINKFVLLSVSEMPVQGGYELTDLPAMRMKEAFTMVGPSVLFLEASLATPSYCTTATYMVFYKTLEKLWAANSLSPSERVLKALKPKLEKDGVGLWGRWNSNGPGTAKLFFDSEIGMNFDDPAKALPGDFMKIFWNDEVGKFEKGHTGIFLGLKTTDGKKMLSFWASSKSTDGFAERTIPLSEAKRIVFSRLTHPENIERLGQLAETDTFLASMLTQVSSWEELRKVSGF